MADEKKRLDTVQGATYKIGGRLVNANGEPVKQAEAPKPQGGAKPQAETKKG